MLIKERAQDEDENSYQFLKNLVIQKVGIKVKVEDIRSFTIQNDEEILEARKPFEPYGIDPEAGINFYFSHPELATKKLDGLEVDLQWMGLSDPDLKNYYANYWKILNADAGLPETVQYRKVNALLLNEGQRQNQRIAELERGLEAVLDRLYALENPEK